MKQSKITQILKTNEWESKYGKMYSITLKLENWETITLNKKKQNAFKLWDNVKYEEIEAWKKRKEIIDKKPESNQGNPRSYFTSVAFQIAFQNYSWEDSYQFCSTLARRIYSDMMDNYENKQPEEEKVEEAKTPAEVLKEKAKTEDDLPF